MSTASNSSPDKPPRESVAGRTDLCHPQARIDEFWSQFASKTPSKATSIIPPRWYSKKATHRKHVSPAATGSRPAYASYDAAAAQCRAKVDHIVQECRRTNQKYRDPHFDLEFDCQLGIDDCLNCLDNNIPDEEDDTSDEGTEPTPPRPRAVQRVTDIFDKPQFFIDGPSANDVRQGLDGDCWLMAALCTMSNKAGLVERVCVARNEAVGVYGFVFHRDGEWVSEVIDDKLYLKRPDYEDSNTERSLFEDRLRVNSEEAYRKLYQSNSGALFFAQCENPNETWLPLLEKAYAKAHGDYGAIDGGFTGEGIEDLTGGVTTDIYTTDILDKEHFWTHEIMRVNETFLFGCSTGGWGRGRTERNGIYALHAYSVMRAVEIDGVRLVLLRNPWGSNEWKGPWSDGSKEWTAAWIEKLGHRFGDDGAFWISYDDLLRKYQEFDRTRLFDASWRLATAWTTMNVPWTLAYNDCRFAFTLTRPGPVVLVLSQLDDRYFRGLEGQYSFALGFRVHRVGSREDDHDEDDGTADYVVRTQDSYRMTRSASVEITLEAGSYHVLVKINGRRRESVMPPEDVVRANAKTRRDKLIRIGRAYDLAHSKGAVAETAEEKEARRAAKERREAREKAQIKKKIMEARQLEHLKSKHLLRNRRKAWAKKEAKRAAKAEKAKEAEAKAAEETKTETKQAEKSEKAEEVKVEVKVETGEKVDSGLEKDKEESKEKDESKEEDEKENDESKEKKESNDSGLEPQKADDVPEKSAHHLNDEKEPARGRQESRGGRRSTQSSLCRRPCSPESDLDSVSSLSDISDGELEIHYQMQKQDEQEQEDALNNVLQLGGQEQPPQPPQPPQPNNNQKEEAESDPWNAVAVVGLRVYYQTVEGDAKSSEKEETDEEIVKLWVERPKPIEESEEDSEEDKDTVAKEDVPDLDDSLRDATAKLRIG